MPKMIPRTKAPQGEQLSEVLQSELATYEKVGLFQRSINTKTAYRYRGVLLRYQKALGGVEPTIEASKIFLAHLREQGFKPSTLRIYRAALQGFHIWRSENLEFPIRVPHHTPPYIEADVVTKLFDLAQGDHRDQLILRLLADAGLRREEAVNLKVRNVGEKALRIRGKGDKDRTIPLTEKLVTDLRPFCSSKNPDDLVLSVGEGVIYRVVKKYGRLAGKPELKPHDLRHAFATRLLERGSEYQGCSRVTGA